MLRAASPKGFKFVKEGEIWCQLSVEAQSDHVLSPASRSRHLSLVPANDKSRRFMEEQGSSCASTDANAVSKRGDMTLHADIGQKPQLHANLYFDFTCLRVQELFVKALLNEHVGFANQSVLSRFSLKIQRSNQCGHKRVWMNTKTCTATPFLWDKGLDCAYQG